MKRFVQRAGRRTPALVWSSVRPRTGWVSRHAVVMAAAVAALSTPTAAELAFNVAGGGWPSAAHRDAAVAAIQSTVNRYNAYGDFGNYNVHVYYNAGIPTAQANYLGSIGFGGTYPNERVMMHELAHYLGSGTYGDPWDGPRGEAMVDQFDGIEASLNGDSAHFWPYGLNFDSEGSEINKQRHVALMYAQRADMGIGSTANPWTATVVNLTASDPLGTSGFNYANTWSDNRFAHPGAAYSTGQFLMRTPESGNSFRFVGDSLRVNNTNGINGGLLYKGTGTSGVTTFNNLILDGGHVRHASQAGDLFRLAGKVTLVQTGTIDAAQGNITVSASIGGSGSLTKTGPFALTLTAGNTYAGNTTINAGTLRLAPSSAVASYTFDSVGGNVVFNGGTGGAAMNGTLANGATIVGGGRFGNAVSLANGASVDINNPIVDLGNNASWTVSAWVKTTAPGGSILTKGDGTGWSNGNTIFYLGDGSAGGSGGVPSAVRWAGGFFQGASGTPAVTDGNWHQLTYVNSGGVYAIYVDGVAIPLSPGNAGFGNADIGSIVRLGISTNSVAADGTLNFNGLLDSVQFYGSALSDTQVAALYQGLAAGPLPVTTNVSIASGATLDVNGITQQIASLSGPAGSSVTLGNGQLIVSPSATGSPFAGAISGSGGTLVKAGTGTLTLAGASSYTGGTTVSAGTLAVGNNTALGSGPVVLSGGTLTSASNSGAEPAIANAITVVGTGRLAAGAGTLFRINGNLSGSGALDLSGTFNSAGLRLAGNNAGLSGTVTVTGANTRLGSANAGSAAARWVVDGNLQTDVVGGATFHLGALSGGGNISGHANNATPAVSTLSVGALNASTTFAGTIIDDALNTQATGNADGAQRNVLALTKVGSGTLTLSGANAYTGTTTVQGGTLMATLAAHAPILTNAGGADVRGGRLVLDYAGGASVSPQVLSALDAGYDQSTRFGTGQIRSTGLAPNRLLGWVDSGTAVSIAPTLAGDFNLDLAVTFDDLLTLAQNYGLTGRVWDDGDANYDGAVNFDDLLSLAQHYGQVALATGATGLAMGTMNSTLEGGLGTVVADWALAQSLVPEPSALLAVGLAASGCVRRRRRA